MALSLARALGRCAESELVDLHDRWVGGEPPTGRKRLLDALKRRMGEPTAAAAVRAELEEHPEAILRLLIERTSESVMVNDLAKECGLQIRAARNALDDLDQRGLAFTTGGGGRNGKTAWIVPSELEKALKEGAATSRDPRELLTLHGHLEHHFAAEDEDGAGEKARKMYRFMASESALCARFDSLDDGLREKLMQVVTRHGGVISSSEYTELTGGSWDPAALQTQLEEAALGTVGELDLEQYGIRQRGSVLSVFNEGVLALLRRSGGLNEEPAEIASIGVDFVSNFSRFTSFVGDQNVRFTVRGTIFKSTGKRISENLIPNPGKEFKRREILDLLYRFALAYRLIDRTGERAFMLTPEGQEFLRSPLEEKQVRMLDWLIEDRDLPGDMRHQLPLRRTTLRYLKRLETGIWYDAMFLPFVVRNHYVGALGAEEGPPRDSGSFPVRSSADLQSLAWNLFTWIRKHLYLLGVLDMGYDKSGRACAFRLTTLGAKLLGMISGRELGGAGHIVVNPDFEVVLFPEENSHELVYMLDRFCDRELTDSLYHYRITPQSLHRALAEGMSLDKMVALLEERSRTPLPQNVLFSLESWAKSGGMVTLSDENTLTCASPEILDRLEGHAELKSLVKQRADSHTLQLESGASAEKLEEWVRDLGVAFRNGQ